MRIEFSFKRNGEVIERTFECGTIRQGIRRLRDYIYDQQDINKEDWVIGYVYEDDICLGEINYYGNFIKKDGV